MGNEVLHKDIANNDLFYLKVPYVVFMKFTVFDAYSNMTCIREERTLPIFGPGPALTLLCFSHS